MKIKVFEITIRKHEMTIRKYEMTMHIYKYKYSSYNTGFNQSPDAIQLNTRTISSNVLQLETLPSPRLRRLSVSTLTE
jgi:uncharacterized protein with NAD-binding domain and iron-sulfur cluster